MQRFAPGVCVMAFESAGAAELFFLGRVIFGGMLTVSGLKNFTEIEKLAAQAQSNGVPAANVLVPFASGMLLLGGLGVVAGVYPIIAGGMIAAFFLVVTPIIWDFWAIDDPEERAVALNNFLSNTMVFGAALLVIAVGGHSWPYAVNVGL